MQKFKAGHCIGTCFLKNLMKKWHWILLFDVSHMICKAENAQSYPLPIRAPLIAGCVADSSSAKVGRDSKLG